MKRFRNLLLSILLCLIPFTAWAFYKYPGLLARIGTEYVMLKEVTTTGLQTLVSGTAGKNIVVYTMGFYVRSAGLVYGCHGDSPAATAITHLYDFVAKQGYDEDVVIHRVLPVGEDLKYWSDGNLNMSIKAHYDLIDFEEITGVAY